MRYVGGSRICLAVWFATFRWQLFELWTWFDISSFQANDQMLGLGIPRVEITSLRLLEPPNEAGVSFRRLIGKMLLLYFHRERLDSVFLIDGTKFTGNGRCTYFLSRFLHNVQIHVMRSNLSWIDRWNFQVSITRSKSEHHLNQTNCEPGNLRSFGYKLRWEWDGLNLLGDQRNCLTKGKTTGSSESTPDCWYWHQDYPGKISFFLESSVYYQFSS